MKYAHLKDTDLKILKFIGTRGKAWKHIIEKSIKLSHSAIYDAIGRLLEGKFIKEAGEEQVKGRKRKLYELTFTGALIALSEMEKPNEIEKLITNNSDKNFFNMAYTFLSAGLREEAQLYVEVLRDSVSKGFINPELIDEKDSQLFMLILLMKRINEKLDYFREKAKKAENEHLRKYYQIMQEAGSAYAAIFTEELWKKQLKSILELAKPILGLS